MPNFLRAKSFPANIYRKEDRRNAYKILLSESEGRKDNIKTNLRKQDYSQ
jgi:hypothetical protein